MANGAASLLHQQPSPLHFTTGVDDECSALVWPYTGCVSHAQPGAWVDPDVCGARDVISTPLSSG